MNLTEHEYKHLALLGHEARLAQARDPEYQPKAPRDDDELDAWMVGWDSAEALVPLARQIDALLHKAVAR